MTPPDIPMEKAIGLLDGIAGLDARSLRPLRPGSWASAFAFDCGDGPRVIRFSHNPDDFDRDAYAYRFRSSALVIPRVTHRGALEDAHFAISERIDGGFLDELDGDGLDATLPSLLTMLDALRTADVSGSTGYGIWDTSGNGAHRTWKDYLRTSIEDDPAQRTGSWRAKLETYSTGAAAFDRDVALLLRRIKDMPEMRSVIHGDLLNYNVFATGNRISGVIDWGCAMYGDPVFELAWFGFWWPWYPQWHDVDVVGAALHAFRDRGADLTSFRDRLLCYELQIGLTHQAYHAAIDSWDMLEAVTRHTTTVANEIR